MKKYSAIFFILFILFNYFSLKGQSNCSSPSQIYVRSTGGSTTGQGTILDPVTWDRAMALVSASRNIILVENGVYTLSPTTAYSLPGTTVLDGRYIISGSDWIKSSNLTSTLNIAAPLETPGTGIGAYVALKIGGNSVYIKDITINNTTAASGTTNSRGNSVYGIYATNRSDLYVSRSSISTLTGSNGADGATGNSGSTGFGGTKGHPGDNDDHNNCDDGSEVNNGRGGNGAGTGAGTGGAGTMYCNGTTGSPGAASTNAIGGGGGGGGGSGGRDDGSRNGSNGGAGGAGANGSVGGPGGGGGATCNECNASAASNGNPGGTGSGYSDNVNIATNSSYGAWFTPGPQANSGNNGTGGSGGAGGGGGAAQQCTVSCDDGSGNGGGGGGGGGSGGTGGTGGFGGGGTFGIYATSSSNLYVTNSTISTGAAGTGGNGGAGGAIGAGGTGGSGGDTDTDEVGRGGNGGNGGNGGGGGRGQDGANGASGNIYNGTSFTGSSIPNPSTVTASMFGMCTNSEIIITRNSSSWTDLGMDGNYIMDLTSGTSSYNSGISTVSVYYTSTGHKTLQVGGTDYTNYIYIARTRALPVINAVSSPKCVGVGFTISTPTSGTQYQWVVYKDGTDAGTPVATSTSNSFTFTPATTGRYYARLRVKEDCCGWSTFVHSSSFDVIDEPNAATNLAISGGPYCFTGSGQSFTITTTGTLANSTYDRWHLYNQDPSVGSPASIANNTTGSFTVTPSQTTTYWIQGENACDKSATLSVIAYISGDAVSTGVLATSSSSRTCAVNDNLWHYFRNGAGEIIAAINSNGQNLGNTTLAVTLNSNPTEYANGGSGHGGMCNGINELALRRSYTLTTTNTPGSGTTSLRLFFTNADYTNYTNAILARVTTGYPYTDCYGSTINQYDLTISRNLSKDLTTGTTGTGPGSSIQYQLELSPSSLRLGQNNTVNIVSAGPTTFHWHTTGGIGEPLPVELTSFIGWNENTVNKLQWTTASESNSYKFIVEKSLNGNDWYTIADQKAAGNSNVNITYTVDDKEVFTGNNYYRIKIIDNDSTYEYSNIINIPTGSTLASSISIFPNPTTGKFSLTISADDNYTTSLKIIDIAGKIISDNTHQLKKGNNSIGLNLSSLADGIYIVQFADKTGSIQTAKVVKSK